MKPTRDEMKRYLEQLDEEALVQIEDILREALQRLRPDGRAETARRPHLAMPERRRGDRYQVRLQAICKDAVFPDNRQLHQDVTVTDLSYTGCRFRSARRIDPGRIVSLRFTDPSGKTREVEVCVVRTREAVNTDEPFFESGARAVTAGEVARARREFREIEAICRRLADHEGIGIMHVLGGAAEGAVRERLRAARYDVIERSAPPQFAADVEGIDMVVCPASLFEPEETAWVARLQTEQPGLGFLFVAETDEELARLATASGAAGRVLPACRVAEDILLAIDQTFCGEQILQGDIEMEPRTFKVLVAGPDERHLRQIETLLLQEDFLVTKCLRRDLVPTAARHEDFQIAILDASFCLGEGKEDILAALRSEDPLLSFVVETAEQQEIVHLMGKGADLILTPRANRQELLTRLRTACRIHKTRLYLS